MAIRELTVRPTLIGTIAVLVWGLALPIFRLLEEQMGLIATMGTVSAGTGLIGLLNMFLRRQLKCDRAVFANPFFYGRWACFVLHEALIVSAIFLVQKKHLAIVILINYLWLTAVIVFSMLFAGVKITRWTAFLSGSSVVIISLALELLGPKGFSMQLFAKPSDALAYAMAFVGALAWGAYSALTRRSGEASGGGSVLPLFQLTLSLMLPLTLLPQFAFPMRVSNSGLALLAGYCIASFLRSSAGITAFEKEA